jgi:hypothetical protein
VAATVACLVLVAVVAAFVAYRATRRMRAPSYHHNVDRVMILYVTW